MSVIDIVSFMAQSFAMGGQDWEGGRGGGGSVWLVVSFNRGLNVISAFV